MAAPSKHKPRKLSPLRKGTLVMWNDQKGFGFIHPEGSEEDYFVHISNFKKGLSRRPEIGDAVLFRAQEEAEGKKRASFATIPALKPEPEHAASHFELNPRRRTWVVNLLIITPLVLSGYLLIMAQNPITFFSY